MPYQLCKAVTKRFRTLEVFGCSADFATMDNTCSCLQGAYTPAGCCCNWTVPTGVTQIQVELWGAGGGGGAGSANECCGTHPGGGGGGYAKYTLSVTPGTAYTICAGAGGRGGAGNDSGSNYCCCGTGGNCSYFATNAVGAILADSVGGCAGLSQCYEFCGCVYFACNQPVCDGCTLSCGGVFNGSPDMRVGATHAYSWGCDANCSQQMNWGGGSGMGASQANWNYLPACYAYYIWNTGCTNSQGIAGHGLCGGCCMLNNPGSAWYNCATSCNWNYCGRAMPATNGNFPGGGAPAGVKTACCLFGSSGGHGSPGYVRITF